MLLYSSPKYLVICNDNNFSEEGPRLIFVNCVRIIISFVGKFRVNFFFFFLYLICSILMYLVYCVDIQVFVLVGWSRPMLKIEQYTQLLYE